ncbi:hypothetical protein [Paracoccus sp. (in: a-proteobacteria)]|uniref:hypothetical protein n=1 Tax=Paracoccus sp. TaxID=267 RepID=UPI003A876015
MYMDNTITSYYLPLYGVTMPATATELGANTRSVFVRPITAIGDMVVQADAQRIDIDPALLDYDRFNEWLASYHAYRNAATAGGGSGATGAAGGGGTDAVSGGPETTHTTSPPDEVETASGNSAATDEDDQGDNGSGNQQVASGGSTWGSGNGWFWWIFK